MNLDVFWLKDDNLEDSADLPTPDILGPKIADDLQTAPELFTAIAEKVKAVDQYPIIRTPQRQVSDSAWA